MIAPFDIFRTEPDGSALWLECCAELETAKTRVYSMKPGAYFILSQRTGHKLAIEVSPGETIHRPVLLVT
jgi:hypothetical protein